MCNRRMLAGYRVRNGINSGIAAGRELASGRRIESDSSGEKMKSGEAKTMTTMVLWQGWRRQ